MFDSTELFCVIDDFFLKFEATYWKFLKQSNHCLRIRTGQLSISEITFIAIWYRCSHFNNFKAFFSWLKQDKCNLFKSLPCYQRMIHLINMHQLVLHAPHVALMKGQYKQYLWIDSTTLPVCKNRGNLLIWFDPITKWHAQANGKQGCNLNLFRCCHTF